jgi:hypothetical protein
MSESKKVDHWAFLATELGAAVPEPEIPEEIAPPVEESSSVEDYRPETIPPTLFEDSFQEVSAEEPVVAERVADVPAMSEPRNVEPPPVRAERSRSSWDLLANELGIEAPPEPQVEPEPEMEPISGSMVETPPPVVERSEAERMFESLFSPRGAQPEAENKSSPAKEDREEWAVPRREERQSVSRREEPRRGGREERPRHGGREEKSRRGSREEEPRRELKDEPFELFLDEDFDVEEPLETAFAPPEERAEPEEKKKRRSRRRGRKDRSKEPEQVKPEKPIIGKAKALAEEDEERDEFSFFEEPETQLSRTQEEEPDEDADVERPGKHRRSRRAQKSKQPSAESREVKKPPVKKIDKIADEDDDLWDDDLELHPVGYSRQGGAAKGSEGRERGEIRPAFRSIPTWDDAVGAMIARNMESRGKRPSGGGQNRGGRRDNRR